MTDALIGLADHDTATNRARHAVAHPSSVRARDEAVAELRALRDEKRELDLELEPLRASAATLERDAAQARARAATIAERLDAATGAGRELEAMAHERDALTTRADRLDDELLEVLELLEPLDARDAALRARAAAVTAARDELAGLVEEERTRDERALAALEDSRAALAEKVPAAVLARYEAIAARRDGVGAARLVDGRCEACHVRVPSALADKLAHDPASVAEVCDECGRLLVVP